MSDPTSMNTPAVAEALEAARTLVEQGRVFDAERLYERVLIASPENLDARVALGNLALRQNGYERAAQLFREATLQDPDNLRWREGLGMACLGARRLDEAADALGHVARLAPKLFGTCLHYGYVLDLLGRERDALVNYFAAITQAQAQGLWLSDATTEPWLRKLVKHATRQARGGRKRLFEDALGAVRRRYGADALRGVEQCLQVYLGELPTNYPDARQKPKFLYFPGLPTTTYFARELFPWYALLEDNFAAILEELLAVLGSQTGLEPFLKFHSREDVQHYLGGVVDPTWDAFFFYRHGERYDANCERCPRTAAVLDALPTLVHIRDHAPEACFSVLTPGTHILKHRGVTNTRLVTHLPLVVPENCALSVGGELHAWQEGRCITFDDTFEHEAWNRSDRTRVVMLLDVWNPHLSKAECDAVTDLVEAIGTFNRECGVAEE
jgi:aspartate beta-hydroxylase